MRHLAQVPRISTTFNHYQQLQTSSNAYDVRAPSTATTSHAQMTTTASSMRTAVMVSGVFA